MPFHAPHVKVRFQGHFGTSGSTIDGWSTGLRIADVGGTALLPSESALVNFLETISGPLATFHGAGGVYASTACFLDQASAAVVGVDGKYYSPSAQTIIRPFVPVVAGSGTCVQPWTTALVCSLRTNFARGYASNGRMYWPAPAVTVAATSGRASASLPTVLGFYKTLFDAINSAAAAMSADARICVLSNVGNGHFSPVRSLRMDSRLDSIERRENNTPSTYTSVQLA